jgi:hypothetical protein
MLAPVPSLTSVLLAHQPLRPKFLIVWEDSNQGGDYDSDVSGILRYQVSGGKLYVYTQVFSGTRTHKASATQFQVQPKMVFTSTLEFWAIPVLIQE